MNLDEFVYQSHIWDEPDCIFQTCRASSQLCMCKWGSLPSDMLANGRISLKAKGFYKEVGSCACKVTSERSAYTSSILELAPSWASSLPPMCRFYSRFPIRTRYVSLNIYKLGDGMTHYLRT